MKIVWKKKTEESGKKRSRFQTLTGNPNLPFESAAREESGLESPKDPQLSETLAANERVHDPKQLAECFQSEGDRLAEAGKYREALGRWESALNLMPENAVLHEQKAQVLLEIGDAWNALKAATRATELKPSWPEAWITLGRSQLNFGELDSAIQSFDKALAMKPDLEAQADREMAIQHVKKRKQLHLSDTEAAGRYRVGDKVETS